MREETIIPPPLPVTVTKTQKLILSLILTKRVIVGKITKGQKSKITKMTLTPPRLERVIVGLEKSKITKTT